MLRVLNVWKNFDRQHAENNGLCLLQWIKKKNKIDKLSKTNGEKINMWISCGYILISLHYMEAGEAVEAAHYIFIISRKLSLMSLNLMIRVLRNTVKKKRYMRQ